MFSVRVALLLVPLALVAASVTVVFPAAVGVPEISPVEALADNPAGKPVTRKLVGELAATIWYENATFTVPLAERPFAITGTAVAPLAAPVVTYIMKLLSVVLIEVRAV